MAINLQKGQRSDIGQPKFTIGLGWDTNTTSTGVDFDLDASVFILGSNRKILADEYFVFYNNLKSPDGAVEHTGDNKTGDGDGDDETIRIDLNKINPQATEIIVVVTIHEAASRKQNFGQVRNSYMRLFDESNNQEIMKFELEEDFSIETALEFGRIYKKDDKWRFEASGVGHREGLEKYLEMFG